MSTLVQGGFPFLDDANAPKFRGLFIPALKKVQRQVHSTLGHDDAALEFVEELLYRILAGLCVAQPRSPFDVEERVQKTFPHPIEGWAVKEAQRALENHSAKKKQELVFPADKLHSLLQKEVLGYKIDHQVSLYIAAVLEYMSADVLKLSGNYVRNSRRTTVTTQDIKVAMSADKVLLEMFDADAAAPAEEDSLAAEKASLTYEELIKDLLLEESQYIRDLNMISHVFRKSFIDAGCTTDVIQAIFGNLDDIHELTLNLLNSLEDALEMCNEGDSGKETTTTKKTEDGKMGTGPTEEGVKQVAPIGLCFEDLAVDGEFSVYETYAENYKSVPAKLERLLIDYKLVTHFRQNGPSQHFLEAMRYVLPKLLLGPIYHCYYYFDTLNVLWMSSPDQDDRDSFEEALSVLHELQSSLERICKTFLPKKRDDTVRFQRRPVSRSSVKKLVELQKNIDQWEGGDIATSCSELLLEGDLQRHMSKKKFTERHVFLLDGLLLCCKTQQTRKSASSAGSEYRLKEKFNVRKMELIDLEDFDDLKYAFDVSDSQKKVTLMCKSKVEKSEWMNALVILHVRSTLDRTLDAILREEELAIPLPMPDPSIYKFASSDTTTNLIFEEGVQENYGVPVIRGGTLHKLVERLTYHKYADPAFVRTFLTTYRSFVEPSDLLTLLIERYSISSPVSSASTGRSEGTYRESLKRFKREYVQPVQLRILNVLRQWVDNHFYDFERDPSLEARLTEFVGNVKGKSMEKWVESIRRAVERKHDSEAEAKLKSLTFETPPPPVEWHLTKKPEEFSIITLHPVEIARQLTIIEANLFKAVKPSELVGGAWTKAEKAKNSPNLLKLIRFTTDVTFWYEQCVVESDCLEERAAVINRLVDIMAVLYELNNFDGVIAIVSAFNSSSIHRLEHTLKELKPNRRQFLDDMKQLTQDHYRKYKEKLRSINPPCVPFAGLYLTNILHIEAGNKDWLTVEGAAEDTIINFSKRRKVAEVTGEIQQYQNQPYCLDENTDIANFLLKLDPTKGRSDNEFEEYLFKRSKEIESKGKPPLKAPRRTKWDLKAPPITKPYRHQSFTVLPGVRRLQTTFNSLESPAEKSPKKSEKSVSPTGPRSPSVLDHDVSLPLATPPASPPFRSVTLPDGGPSSSPPPILPPRQSISRSDSYLSQSMPSTFDRPPPLPPPPLPPHSRVTNGGENVGPPLPPRSPRLSLQDPDPPALPPRTRPAEPPKLPPRMSGLGNADQPPVLPPRANKPS